MVTRTNAVKSLSDEVDFSLSESKCTVSKRAKGAETRSSKSAMYRKETTLKRNFQKLRDSNRAAAHSAASNQLSGLLLSPRVPTRRNVYRGSCKSKDFMAFLFFRQSLHTFAHLLHTLQKSHVTLRYFLSFIFNSFPEGPLRRSLRGSLFFGKNSLHSSEECGWEPRVRRLRIAKQGVSLFMGCTLFFYACFFCTSASIRASSVPDSCIPRFIHSCTQPYSI